jgi:hypothetical protein
MAVTLHRIGAPRAGGNPFSETWRATVAGIPARGRGLRGDHAPNQGVLGPGVIAIGGVGSIGDVCLVGHLKRGKAGGGRERADRVAHKCDEPRHVCGAISALGAVGQHEFDLKSRGGVVWFNIAKQANWPIDSPLAAERAFAAGVGAARYK